MDTHISVRNLNAYYGKQQALRDINVEIPRNQITVILGPSGCGKSTLLKSLNRLLRRHRGSARHRAGADRWGGCLRPRG